MKYFTLFICIGLTPIVSLAEEKPFKVTHPSGGEIPSQYKDSCGAGSDFYSLTGTFQFKEEVPQFQPVNSKMPKNKEELAKYRKKRDLERKQKAQNSPVAKLIPWIKSEKAKLLEENEKTCEEKGGLVINSSKVSKTRNISGGIATLPYSEKFHVCCKDDAGKSLSIGLFKKPEEGNHPLKTPKELGVKIVEPLKLEKLN